MIRITWGTKKVRKRRLNQDEKEEIKRWKGNRSKGYLGANEDSRGRGKRLEWSNNVDRIEGKTRSEKWFVTDMKCVAHKKRWTWKWRTEYKIIDISTNTFKKFHQRYSKLTIMMLLESERKGIIRSKRSQTKRNMKKKIEGK